MTIWPRSRIEFQMNSAAFFHDGAALFLFEKEFDI